MYGENVDKKMTFFLSIYRAALASIPGEVVYNSEVSEEASDWNSSGTIK